MTDAADLVFTDGELHTLGEPDETHTALAVRDGEIVRLGNDYDIEFLAGPETTRIDLDGRVVVPGFVDAHTHLTNTGRSLVHADLSTADTATEAVELLETRAAETGETEAGGHAEYVLGFGYDESRWPGGEYLTAAELDPVGGDRPVIAFREDMHVASVDSVTLERHRDAMPDDDVQTDDGEPTGVVVEEAVDPLYDAVEPDRAATRELIEAAQTAATRRGVTGIHDMVRRSHAPEVYRDLDAAGDLDVRVRLNYWTDHLDALIETGARTNHGTEMVQTGAIKTYTDGTFGGRTAKLSAPYADGDDTGQWVVDPDQLREYVARADDHGFQFTAHAIGDEAIRAVVDAYEHLTDPATARHRIEHVELADDDLLDRIADAGIVASMQPNFLKWAGEGGLYDTRLGDRRDETNRLAAHHERDTHLAFGSDCMPLDPLIGVHHAVNAPEPAQRLGVTDALRAYTSGAAYAGFDEDRLGTIEPGKRADLTVLGASPWNRPAGIREIDVVATVVDGRVVYDGL
ncbi:MAG: putative metal-dependent hydrolase [halophilic archaeon J07HB67]|nr:MAG: putative metal-dependent hydrolase [halophilic archaeon J07HB67]